MNLLIIELVVVIIPRYVLYISCLLEGMVSGLLDRLIGAYIVTRTILVRPKSQ